MEPLLGAAPWSRALPLLPAIRYDASMAREIVLGIDPGLASTGWGVVEKNGNRMGYLAHGVVSTPAKMPHQERLVMIFRGISDVLDRWQPVAAGMETLYFAKNVSSAMGVAEARGVVTLTLALRGIELLEFTPHGIKQAVVGVARADKNQVQQAVKLLLGLSEIPKPDHAADALAAAITRINTARLAI